MEGVNEGATGVPVEGIEIRSFFHVVFSLWLELLSLPMMLITGALSELAKLGEWSQLQEREELSSRL